MPEPQSIELRGACCESLASDTCPACQGKKKTRQSFCLKCYRKLPRATQKELYYPDGYVTVWHDALMSLGGEV